MTAVKFHANLLSVASSWLHAVFNNLESFPDGAYEIFTRFFYILENVKEALKTQVKNEGKISAGVKENILFFVLKEHYEKKKLSFQALRGQDQIWAQALVHCELFKVHLAVVTFCEGQDREDNNNSSIIKPTRWIDKNNESKSEKKSEMT